MNTQTKERLEKRLKTIESQITTARALGGICFLMAVLFMITIIFGVIFLAIGYHYKSKVERLERERDDILTRLGR